MTERRWKLYAPDENAERRSCLLYVHGQGGSAEEAEHYLPLFPNRAVRGLDYAGDTPWEAGEEIREAAETLRSCFDRLLLVANSIGAFYAMQAGIDALLERAWFISPIVDMEALIRGMMARIGATEEELKARRVISVPFGQDLSWDYLQYVRTHPLRWAVPTRILCGGRDELAPLETMTAFAERQGAELTVMETGGHWFHTPEEMAFLDAWITAE